MNHQLTNLRNLMSPLPMLVIALPFGLTACGSSNNNNDSDTVTGGVQSQAVTIPFEAMANGTPIDCDTTLTGLGVSGSDADLKDFRFYVHNLKMGTDQGREVAVTLDDNLWQSKGIALVDFQNKGDACDGDEKQTHKEITGSVPLDSGESVNSISFTIGVPSDLNHEDQTSASTPLNIASMFWSWQTGYKFMRFDVAPTGGLIRPGDPTYSNSTWNFHLGSTDCVGDPQLGETVICGRNDRPQVTLTNYDPQTNTIMLDYSELVAGANLGADEGGAPGCMSGATDPECSSVFNKLGLDMVSGEVDSTNPQTVFSLQ